MDEPVPAWLRYPRLIGIALLAAAAGGVWWVLHEVQRIAAEHPDSVKLERSGIYLTAIAGVFGVALAALGDKAVPFARTAVAKLGWQRIVMVILVVGAAFLAETWRMHMLKDLGYVEAPR